MERGSSVQNGRIGIDNNPIQDIILVCHRNQWVARENLSLKDFAASLQSGFARSATQKAGHPSNLPTLPESR